MQCAIWSIQTGEIQQWEKDSGYEGSYDINTNHQNKLCKHIYGYDQLYAYFAIQSSIVKCWSSTMKQKKKRSFFV